MLSRCIYVKINAEIAGYPLVFPLREVQRGPLLAAEVERGIDSLA